MSALTSMLAAAAILTGIGVAPRTDTLGVIHFTSDSARVEDDAQPALAATLRWLDAHPERVVYVEGYADRRGGSAANLELSYERSRAVRDELVRRGVAPARVVVAAHGEDRDLAGAAPARSVVVRGSTEAFPVLLEAQREPARPARRPPPTRPTS
jgi:outer membrane protein OmpA-like peptidoglycan-associated protein